MSDDEAVKLAKEWLGYADRFGLPAEVLNDAISSDQMESLARAVVAQHEEIERLAHTLHRHHAHPDYEYETTKTGRKTGESLRPVGEGWEPNDVVEIESYKDGVVVGPSTWRAWDRFEFHEEEYWRRRIRP